MGRRENKNPASFVFLLTATAGIAIFISAWNSFQKGKDYIFLSLVFLILFLIGILYLYILFSRIYSVAHKKDIPDDKNSNSAIPAEETSKGVISGNREVPFSLLKGVFVKANPKNIGEKILKNLSQEFEIIQGVFFVLSADSQKYIPGASFAMDFDRLPAEFESGEGITGQAVIDNKILAISNLPESYSPALSGLGKGKAKFLYIIPLVHEKKAYGVIEISVFREIDEDRMTALNQLMREGGMKLYSVLFQETK